MRRALQAVSWGTQLVPYAQALCLQEALAEQRHTGQLAVDTLILLQHAPVYTIGKRGTEADFKVPLKDLIAGGATIHRAPRGGEVTYHGPGQLVVYPIVGLRQLGLGARAYVEGLEDTLIATLGHFGVQAHGRVQGGTGVWVGSLKVAAIGVKISHGVSSHGVALNVTTDLSAFNAIIPCGMADKGVTSLRAELQAQQAQGLGTGGQGWGGLGRGSQGSNGQGAGGQEAGGRGSGGQGAGGRESGVERPRGQGSEGQGMGSQGLQGGGCSLDSQPRQGDGSSNMSGHSVPGSTMSYDQAAFAEVSGVFLRKFCAQFGFDGDTQLQAAKTHPLGKALH